MQQLPKQIKSHNIPYDPTNSEAFVYKFTNLIKKKLKQFPYIYGGYHLGKPFDGYMTSSKNPEFHKDFMDPNSEWHYEVISYGSQKYIKAVEYNLLKDNNAKDNPEWYNKHNGGSSTVIPRVKLMGAIAREITKTKSFQGITTTYTRVSDLPIKRLQIRKFTLDPTHVKKIRDRINDKNSLEQLMTVILENRYYRGQTADLIADGNHSINAAETSNFGKQGLMPTLVIPESVHKDWTDEEVDIFAMMLNPREENPRLETDLPTIAKSICNMRLNGLDSNSKEIQDLKDFYKLTTGEKSKVSKLANDMYKEIRPDNTTWINWGAGAEKKQIEEIISKECVTEENETGIFAKCYSTAKWNIHNDLVFILAWNRDHATNKITHYKNYLYHTDEDYKKTWKNKWLKDNEYFISKILKPHGVKIEYIYLPEKRDNVLKGGKII